MRHQRDRHRLSRNRSLYRATMRDLAKATLIQERICTTRAKAKEARRLIEKLITLGKKDTLAARRRAFAILCDHDLVSRLFRETAPRFKTRPGGYTRIIPFVQREGDNAQLAFLELTEKSRMIVSGIKRTKAESAGTLTVSEAQAKPSAPSKETPKAHGPEGHSKADVKTNAPKAASKLISLRRLFQRKTGGE